MSDRHCCLQQYVKNKHKQNKAKLAKRRDAADWEVLFTLKGADLLFIPLEGPCVPHRIVPEALLCADYCAFQESFIYILSGNPFFSILQKDVNVG